MDAMGGFEIMEEWECNHVGLGFPHSKLPFVC